MLSQRELFLRHLAQTTDNPLLIEIEKAEGCYLYGPQGQRYLDLISGISVSNVGHRHPKVLQAIHEQLDKYMHLMVYGEYVQSPQVRLAKALADTLPAPLESVYLVNSGSEAVEGALKLAKRYTGRPNLVSCFHAYHGSSQGALSVGGSEEFKRAYRPLLPGVQHMYFGVEAELEKISTDTAAVIIETVQGEAGVRSACTRYWQALSKRCKETGTLLILDEIQTGFGRTGTFWGFEHYGIQPDILVTAKGMGGGMPIGAFISSRHIMQSLSENPILGHITTFGGHPVSAAASLATLQLIVEEELHTLVASKAALFKALLVHPKIKMLRQMGFLMALEFEDFTQNKRIIDRAIAKGLITDWFLFCDNSLRIAPPLVISESQIREACAVILECVDEVG
jgi:acetylornithine/succinyldiaminopimelate/putrescine aminotransferase